MSQGFPLVLPLVLSVNACAVSHEMGTMAPCNPEASTAEIAWYGPVAPKDRDLGDIRCRTVGPPALDLYPASRFERLQEGDSLAVLSFNIDVGAGDLLSFLGTELGLACRGEDSSTSSEFPHFVILVQEAFRRWEGLPPIDNPRLAARKRTHPPHHHGDPDIVDIADACGLALAYVPSGRNGKDTPGERRQDKGNAILSTLPVSQILAVENPFETERKVAVAVTVDTPGSNPLRFVNAHLEVTSAFYRNLFTGDQTRVRQAAGLLEALDAHEDMDGRPVPTLLAGDFNTWSGMEATLRMLRKEFPESPPWEGHLSMGPFPTDHMFFRARGNEGIRLVPDSYHLLDDTYLSDHQPLFIWVTVGGTVGSTVGGTVGGTVGDTVGSAAEDDRSGTGGGDSDGR